ncbi:MAG: hypothetical protein F4X92_04870 [Gammaproteobacteria bacterium]|nr:hypothetical protein [Gammaproteobacteria bacterium]
MSSQDYPVSNQTRNEIWQGYLDAERLNRYYQYLADKHRKIDQGIKFTIAFAAVGGVTRLIAALPDEWGWISDVSSVVILFVVIVELVFDFRSKSSVLTRTSENLQHITRDWQMLWNQVDRQDATDGVLLNKMDDLLKKSIESTKPVGQIGLSINSRINQKSWEEAIEVITAQYATRS